MPDAPPKVMLAAPAKPWWRSKTVWFNLATTLPLLLEAAAANLGVLQPLLDARHYPLLVAGITLGNLWLRAVSASGIQWRKGER